MQCHGGPDPPSPRISYYIYVMLKLWVVTSPDGFSAEYDDIEEMFKRGLTRLILDKRGRSYPGGDSSRRATADDYDRWLLSLPMEYRDRIWVRGTPDMAEQLDVRGCVCEALSFMGEVPESWKRVNCIALCKDLDEASRLPAWVAGALLGPVFQPNSALEPVKTLNLVGETGDSSPKITEICEKMPVPLILWGGMEPETLGQVKHLNPAGVAILGGIWNYADPINAFIKMQRACVGHQDL